MRISHPISVEAKACVSRMLIKIPQGNLWKPPILPAGSDPKLAYRYGI